MPTNELDGARLLHALRAAAGHLTLRAAAIDAINVYPVPDGDTGSNMAATLREAVRAAEGVPAGAGAGEILTALATGALYGGRGNSGVILSQALRGIAAAAGTSTTIGASTLRDALAAAATMAYRAVATPVEGTMLTVLRAAAEAARGDTIEAVLESATTGAEAAEAATPALLPALAEAGVTDAGGEGICTILRALAAAITGEPLGLEEAGPRAPLTFAGTSGHERDAFGFCTEFLVEAAAVPIDLDALQAWLRPPEYRSVVVVGDAEVARVHAHTATPQALLDHAAGWGALSRVKVEDMAAQHVRFAQSGSGAGARVALLALSPGEGFDTVFQSLGARTLRLDAVAKPSAGDLAAAADALLSADVLLLPNHPNVLMAAELAASLTRCTLTVIPSRSVTQGIAGTLAFDAAADAPVNATRVSEALRRVRTVEVTTAAADRSADGLAVSAGDAIAFVDGRLVAKAATLKAALESGLISAGAPGALVTLYFGAGVSESDGRRLGEALLRDLHAGDIQVLPGGQELYPYIASVEA